MHRVTVDGFWMDRTPVTNERFARFVAATGHMTFAEIPPNPDDYPGALPEMLYAGSLVFVKPAGTGRSQRLHELVAVHARRRLAPPLRPRQLDRRPRASPGRARRVRRRRGLRAVGGQELPTEAEWEFAARGGLDGAEYAWGDEFLPDDRHWPTPGRASSRGRTSRATATRARLRSALPAQRLRPVDMIGNVWEWTTDWYGRTSGRRGKACCMPQNPRGAARGRQLRPAPARDPDPAQGAEGRLAPCAPNYCRRYRPAARFTRSRSTRRPATSASAASSGAGAKER